ncbi:MAG: hypothetical protein ACI9AB_001894, partial [Urechidicola sp.]
KRPTAPLARYFRNKLQTAFYNQPKDGHFHPSLTTKWRAWIKYEKDTTRYKFNLGYTFGILPSNLHILCYIKEKTTRIVSD